MAAMGGVSRLLSSLTLPPMALLLVLTAVVWQATAAATPPAVLQQKCAEEMATQLLNCLEYAKGQAQSPSQKCCESAKDTRKQDPACLCYVIQQTYEGRPSLKQLGLQLGRLVQLPTACNIPNSNISHCPGLLGINSSSPDYAIFNSSASYNTSAAPNSAGIMNQVRYTYAMASAIASAIALSVFSS